MPRTGVQFIKNDEPSFIRQFKQRVGHKDEADIETKRQMLDRDDDSDEDRTERDDEKPVVVVLKEGDITAEEAEQVEKEKDEGPAHLDQKITFKKPTKRSKEQETKGQGEEEDSSSSSPAAKSKKKDKGNKILKKKNTSLLSFGDDEEEDS